MKSLTLINRIMSNYRRVQTRRLMLLALLLAAPPGSGCWAAPESSYQASAVVFEKADAGLALTIKGNISPTFTTYQLFDPLRVVVDIANAQFADSLHLPIEVNQAPVAKITGTLLTEKKPEIAKFEVLLSTDSPYKVQRHDNDITITFGSGAQDDKQTAPPAKMAPGINAPPQAKEGPQASATKRAPTARPEIYDLKINKTATPVTVLLVADGPLQNCKQVTLPKGASHPDRMYLDIPGVKAPALGRQLTVGAGGVAQIRIADRAEGARFVFDSSLDGMFAFEVAPAPEGLLVTLGAAAGPGPPPKATKGQEGANDPVAKILAAASPPGDDRPAPTGQVAGHANPAPRPPAPKASANNEFTAAGYNREQITVDFYKTNLHNVFRLMGEVGGYNIVVDESVNGVLTLSLREVPWDFLLDVILNLKDLQKVERYNTIVISAKDKGFVWPEKAVDDQKKEEPLVEAPGAEVGLAIDQQLNQPPAVLEAKMLMQRGNALAREGKFKEALALYQSAFDLWPDNANLAKRMAGMCLVDLGYYQAAVDYAKKALAIKQDDPDAALQAAIGLANMHQAEARLYFEKAISGSQPSRTALLSYASFQEEREDLAGTLATLAKFTELYNANLDTMIARARIFDKQEQPERAVAEYKAILLSGYDLAPDLAQYIKGRIALANKQ